MAARVAVVTGANRGLGLHLVAQLQARGWSVVATCRRPDAATALHALAPFAVLPLDTGDPASIAALGTAVRELVPQLGLLVNNAGIMSASAAPVDDDPDDDAAANGPLAALRHDALLELFRVNSVGPVLVTQALAPLLGQGSVVVGVSSRLGSIATQSASEYGYAMSKAALNMGTTLLARELGPQGVVVLAVSPGWVRTDMGGSAAALSPDESTGAIADLVDRVDASWNGRFVGHTGDHIPW